MEIRVLRYFIEMANESSMTRAAERLCISQPTMSKQLKELEKELGAKLFNRSNYNIKLTEAGLILKERAEDIINLVDKTLDEFKNLENLSSGDIYVGAAESDLIKYFAEAVKELQKRFPKIRCNVYSGNKIDVCEKLDKGLLDFAIVTNFLDLSKYNFLKMPSYDIWGVLMKKGDPLAKKKQIKLDDLSNLPLICSRQWLEHGVSQWFGEKAEKANVVATYNLAFNASIMVKAGMGYALIYDKLVDTSSDSELTFRPLKSAPKSEMHIIWRKKQKFSPVAKLLLDELNRRFKNNILLKQV